MVRIYQETYYVPKLRPVALTQCGPKCGYFCQSGRCNRFPLGEPIRTLPDEMPSSGFPDWCHLQAEPVPGDLFQVVTPC